LIIIKSRTGIITIISNRKNKGMDSLPFLYFKIFLG